MLRRSLKIAQMAISQSTMVRIAIESIFIPVNGKPGEKRKIIVNSMIKLL